MALREDPESITSRTEFVAFLQDLARDFNERPHAWENDSLGTFLEAAAAWTEDMDGYYKNVGRPVPAQIDWSVFATILAAARVYE